MSRVIATNGLSKKYLDIMDEMVVAVEKCALHKTPVGIIGSFNNFWDTPMTVAQYAGLSSAVLGVIGTVILFFSSYALEPFQGGVFGNKDVREYNNHIRVKNSKRLRWQRVGLAFLVLSFSVQAVCSFL